MPCFKPPSTLLSNPGDAGLAGPIEAYAPGCRFRTAPRWSPCARERRPDSVLAVADRIGKGVKVFVKYDGLNPTGSFKDRGMTMATKGLEAPAVKR